MCEIFSEPDWGYRRYGAGTNSEYATMWKSVGVWADITYISDNKVLSQFILQHSLNKKYMHFKHMATNIQNYNNFFVSFQ